MFTFKKIALVGAVGLAAFSMSCSDGGEEETGGEITGLEISAGSGGSTYTVKGTVTGTASNPITGIVVTPTNATVSQPTQTGESVTLALGLEPVCGAADVGKSITIKVSVTATFQTGTTTKEATKDHACAGSSDFPLASSTPVPVGGTGSAGSFVDLDVATPIAYTSAQFAANIAKIDIIYGAAFGGGDNIHSTLGAAFTNDLASSTINFSEELAEGQDDFSEVYELTAAEQSTVKSATKLSDVADIKGRLVNATDAETISAANGTAFAVYTTAGDYVFVVITAKNGTTDITIKSVK